MARFTTSVPSVKLSASGMVRKLGGTTSMKYLASACLLSLSLLVVVSSVYAHYKLISDYTEASPRSTTATTPISPHQDPTLIADANTLGIDVSNLNLILTPNMPSGDDYSGPALGVYDDNTRTIYVLSGRSTADETQTLAYEYMHYIWEDVNTPAYDQTEGPLMQAYVAENPSLQANIAQYNAPTTEIYDEIDSTLCTEVAPDQLSPSFNAYCNQAIPNREAVLFP